LSRGRHARQGPFGHLWIVTRGDEVAERHHECIAEGPTKQQEGKRGQWRHQQQSDPDRHPGRDHRPREADQASRPGLSP
jgi:hypothetical protein